MDEFIAGLRVKYNQLAKMFGGRDALPMHGGMQRSNGVSGISTVNKKDQVAFSLGWVVFSLLIVVFGFYHCRSSGYHYTMKCTEENCSLDAYGKFQKITTFSKSDFLDAEFARIDKDGEFADASRIKKDRRGNFGYSIRLKLRLPVEEGSRMKTEKYIIYNPHDMGRRLAKNGHSKMKDYIDGKTKTLYVNDGKSITVIGILSIFFGLVLAMMGCIFGVWEDSAPRRVKKAS